MELVRYVDGDVLMSAPNESKEQRAEPELGVFGLPKRIHKKSHRERFSLSSEDLSPVKENEILHEHTSEASI